MLAMDFIPSTANMIPISDQLDNPPNKNSDLLDILPLELIFRILNSMDPHEYSGFSCTCRHAVTIVNQKLDNPKDKQGLYLGWTHFDDNEALGLQLPPCKSRTARYVDKERRRREWESEVRRRELEDYVSFYYGPPD